MASGLAVYGIAAESNDPLIWSTTAFLGHNVLRLLGDGYRRSPLIAFQVTFFLFLVGGLVESRTSGEKALASFNDMVAHDVFLSLTVASAAMALYSIVSSRYYWRQGTGLEPKVPLDTRKPSGESLRGHYLRQIGFASTVVTSVFAFIVVMDKARFRSGGTVYDFYANYTPGVPSVVVKIGDLFYPSVALFLGTLPSRREARWPLILFLGVSMSSALYGVRNVLVLNVAMIVVYALWRQALGANAWLSGTEIRWVLIAVVPFAMLLQAFDRIRREGALDLTLLLGGLDLSLLREFVRDQGVSVNVLASMVEAREYLGGQPVPYSFGGMYLYLTNNMITAMFGTGELLQQNTFPMAEGGASLASRLAFLYFPTSFVNGVGMGSSFVAELDYDFGLWGVAAGAILVCLLLDRLSRVAARGPVWVAGALLSIRWILYMPRSGFTDWIGSALSILNILFLFSASVAAWILAKNGRFREARPKRPTQAKMGTK